MHLLSLELFGESLPLPEFPRLKSIRGIGLTDKECYSGLLAEKFDYTNTHYDREPRLDVAEPHPQLAGTCDFILAADVLEHIAPPVERALEEMCRLPSPNGFLGVTIYCDPKDRMREHFPDLHEYRVVALGDSNLLIQRRQDGALEIREDLVFHGGSGETLEMREFGITALRTKVHAAGFKGVHLLTADVPEIRRRRAQAVHSCRSATKGSTRAARTAGTDAAVRAVTDKIAAAANVATGSVTWTPKSKDAIHRAATHEAGTPIAMPLASSSAARRKTHPSTSARSAPSAMRIPISPVERATV